MPWWRLLLRLKLAPASFSRFCLHTSTRWLRLGCRSSMQSCASSLRKVCRWGSKMLELKNYALALVAGLLIGVVISWWLTASYKDASWRASIEAQKVEAARQLQLATEKAIQTERDNQRLANQIEVQHVQNTKQLDAVLADNRRLARELGGLRDPGRRTSGECALPTGSDPTGVAAAGTAEGRLSDEASEFLLEFARQADTAAQYASACHQWIKQVTHD